MVSETRIERDSLGEKEIPAHAYYGIETQRAIENFPVSGLRSDSSLVRAYGKIKYAAAKTNADLGVLEKEKAQAIMEASKEIEEGKHTEQFVVDAFQAGGGTSMNMNVNEVIANRALELLGKARGQYDFLSPHDHVNYGQSTNDTYPTALHVAALDKWSQLEPIVEELAVSFEKKGKEFHSIIKAGRTHLQDAVPIRLGQEFRGYAHALRHSIHIGSKAAEGLQDIALGGTAIGTELNVHPRYREKVVQELASRTNFPLRSNTNLFCAINSQQAVGNMSAALRTLALELIRIANDLRLLSSGPATGFAELRLPAMQPGSSIMPAKVNPVILECLDMVCFQVVGNDTATSLALQAGQLELNVMMPCMSHNLLSSFSLLIEYLPVVRERCIEGLAADEERCLNYAYRTTSLGTVLSPKLGYLQTAELMKESLAKNTSIKDLVLEKNIVSKEEAENIFRLEDLCGDK